MANLLDEAFSWLVVILGIIGITIMPSLSKAIPELSVAVLSWE